MFTLLLLIVSFILSCTNPTMATFPCPPCGRNPVPYPLSTAPTCGHQSYKIQCSAGSMYLDALNASSYPITSINPKTQRIIIQPASITPNTCIATDICSEGIKLDSSLPFNITSINTILLMNCSSFMLDVQVNCSSTSVCNAYISYAKSAVACRNRILCCDFTTGRSKNAFRIQIRPDRCMAYQSFVNLDLTLPVAKWPEPGLEIEWALPQEPDCILPVDCRDLKGSRCLPVPGRVGQQRCFCRPGGPALGSYYGTMSK